MIENRTVVLITGAKGGLGTAVTTAFLEAGALVVGSSRSIQNSDFPNPNFAAIQSELSSAASASALVEQTIVLHDRLDAVVHLVGAFTGGKSLAETAEDEIVQMLNANFWSAFHLFRAVLPHMREQGSGSLLAIGSRAAVEPQPMLGAYAISKAALVSMVSTLARENKDRNITANVVLPETMDTPANRKAMPGTNPSHWLPTEAVAKLIVQLTLLPQISGAAVPIYGQEL